MGRKQSLCVATYLILNQLAYSPDMDHLLMGGGFNRYLEVWNRDQPFTHLCGILFKKNTKSTLSAHRALKLGGFFVPPLQIPLHSAPRDYFAIQRVCTWVFKTSHFGKACTYKTALRTGIWRRSSNSLSRLKSFCKVRASEVLLDWLGFLLKRFPSPKLRWKLKNLVNSKFLSGS